MQAFISKYGLAAHLSLLAVAPLFLYPFCSPGTIAGVVLWLSFASAIWLLMEPSRRLTERLHEARVRVRKAIIRDPLFWLFLIILLFAAVRAFNGGVTKLYDPGIRKWILDGPSFPLLPGCVDGHGLLPCASVVSLMVLLLGARHALGKSARIALTSFLALFGGLTAFVWLVAAWGGHVGILRFAGFCEGVWGLTLTSDILFSSPGHAFGLCFLCSIIAAAGMFECQWNKLLLLFSFMIGTTATGLFYFATPLVLLLYACLGVLAVIGCLVYLSFLFRSAVVFRFLVLLLIASVVPVTLTVCFAPLEMAPYHGEVFTTLSSFPASLFPEGFAEYRHALSASAQTIWKENPWLGRGLGSFPLELWLTGGAVHGGVMSVPLNGWWGLLAERGLLGAMALILPLAFMSVTFIWRVLGALRRHVFLPLAVLGVAIVPVMIGMTFVDASCLRTDTLPLAGVLFALAASSFPARKKRSDDEEQSN